jgi:arsenate reductase (glutaredoxin)
MSSESVVLYTYSGCSTCRDAVKWLRARDVRFEERPIRETPPTVPELKRMLALQGGELRRLFNSSGEDYRALDLKTKLPTWTEEQALKALAGNGRLVKRPFLLGKNVGLVGFKPETWAAALKR